MSRWKAEKKKDKESFEKWYSGMLSSIIEVIDHPDTRRFAGEIEVLKLRLKPLEREARMQYLHSRPFTGRAWFKYEIEAWRTGDRNSRVFFLTGEPGIGKSAFIANLAHTHGHHIAALRFIEHDKSDHKDTRQAIRSITFHLATSFPDYRHWLLTQTDLNQLDTKSESDLFTLLISEPLTKSIDGGKDRYLIVIDALDEAQTGSSNPLVQLIAREADKLPDWLGFIVTSRPEPQIEDPEPPQTK